jgi:hypothetical protein
MVYQMSITGAPRNLGPCMKKECDNYYLPESSKQNWFERVALCIEPIRIIVLCVQGKESLKSLEGMAEELSGSHGFNVKQHGVWGDEVNVEN